MHFLFITSNHGTGASEELWTRTAILLKKSGHKVSASTPWNPANPSNSKIRFLADGNITHSDLSRSQLGFRIPRITPQRFWPANLKRLIEKTTPDLIILSSASPLDTLPIARVIVKSKIPYVTLDHGILDNQWPTDTECEQLIPLYSSAKRTFFVSSASAQLAQCQLAHSLKSIEIVRNPFQVDYDSSFSWPKDNRLRVASVGRLLPRTKGQDILLQVLALPIWRERPIDFSIYGDGPCERSLKREATRLGLTTVTFKGHVENVDEIWKEHHAMVLSSRRENMPIALVEPMLCGRPCIATAVGGVTELIDDNVHGFIAHAATVHHLAEALERAWHRRSEWEEIGKAARNHIRSLVPRDPISVFMGILLDLSSSTHQKHSPEQAPSQYL